MSNRSEKQVRNLNRGLFWLTTVLVCLSIGMTGRYGWSMAVEPLDKVINAIGAAVVDIGGALLMGGCGVLFGRKHYAAGALALLMTTGCMAVSAIAIFGYQSTTTSAASQRGPQA